MPRRASAAAGTTSGRMWYCHSGFCAGEGSSSHHREGWASLIDQDRLQPWPWPSGWVYQNWTIYGGIRSPLWTPNASFPAMDREHPFGFSREEKALLVLVPFAGSDAAPTWTIPGGADDFMMDITSSPSASAFLECHWSLFARAILCLWLLERIDHLSYSYYMPSITLITCSK